ncbi:geranylgeranylglycerol-phosphate geranylgeranyltransferase [Halorarum halophilum]|uniref:Digeranylgeranylglyceryl phosphate synthase n=1 Tax=Halorarum halophilum TaxID=2743090 RepID=A0A7D5GK15_9EURY|nr:geranylgeranylglycerol-phosphate geranylgeranyltransferase [Halobaculum halophilum]QLG27164.1 geranylgeranylglycerol-phosphate geranylgeranyltransferase [Halobaculum halophilum]
MGDTRALAGGLLELTRPGNAVAAGALTFIGAFVGGGLQPIPVTLAVAATVFAVAAGNAANDYFDRDIDRVNRPDRPIPSGRVTPRTAATFAGVLFLGAVVAAATLPMLALAIAVVNLLALLAYTELFKGLPGVGNAVVAYLTGSTFLFGAAAVGALGPDVWVLFGLAAVATFARELVKDVEDVAGDREEGLRTLPIVAGERATLTLAVAVMVIGAAASAFPYARGTFGVAYLALVVPADAVMVGATAWGFRDPGTAQRWLKRGTFLAATAFVVGRLAVAG